MPVTLGLLGDLDTAPPTHRELVAAVARMPPEVAVRRVASDAPGARAPERVDGLWVIPGSPFRDDDAVSAAIGWAIDTATPFLGTCAGFQYAAVVLAKRFAGVAGPAHAELDPDAERPVVGPLACRLMGEEREVRCVHGTRLEAILGSGPSTGFHWCGYGLDEGYVAALEAGGVVVGACAPDAGVEALELPGHPFFVATLFQPQVGALAGRPLSPLILAFVAAARARHLGSR